MNYPRLDVKKTGENIKRLRKAKKLSARVLSEMMGLSMPQAVYNWEYGVSCPSIDNLILLREIFKTPIDNIIVTESE